MVDDTRSMLDTLRGLTPDEQAAKLTFYFPDEIAELFDPSAPRAHAGQIPPDSDWSKWLILAGRGFGKTFAGAAWIDARANEAPETHSALIAATLHEARAVMVEGDAGILAVARERPRFEPARRRLTWANGSTATFFGAAEPDSLRGPSFHFAWGDEIAKWDFAEAALANLAMTLRLGDRPRTVLTTTPRPLKWLQALAAPAPGVVVTHGRTVDNRANLPHAYLAGLLRDYGGTRLARQELLGEFVTDLDGALWTRDGFDVHRVPVAPTRGRTVIGVDPPAGAGSKADACGIVVVRLGPDGRGYVVADASIRGATPDGWARAVVSAAEEHDADRVIAEVNNGGAMIESLLRAVEAELPLTSVHAAVGKVARAEPVAALYEGGRVSHVGMLGPLEDELCGLLRGGAYAGPGRSPDRADALVWALTELLLGKVHSPRVRSL